MDHFTPLFQNQLRQEFFLHKFCTLLLHRPWSGFVINFLPLMPGCDQPCSSFRIVCFTCWFVDNSEIMRELACTWVWIYVRTFASKGETNNKTRLSWNNKKWSSKDKYHLSCYELILFVEEALKRRVLSNHWLITWRQSVTGFIWKTTAIRQWMKNENLLVKSFKGMRRSRGKYGHKGYSANRTIRNTIVITMKELAKDKATTKEDQNFERNEIIAILNGILSSSVERRRLTKQLEFER